MTEAGQKGQEQEQIPGAGHVYAAICAFACLCCLLLPPDPAPLLPPACPFCNEARFTESYFDTLFGARVISGLK